jgi:lipopolysaccharide exporter
MFLRRAKQLWSGAVGTRLREQGFFRNVAMLAVGSALAQGLSFVLMPVLSRMYGPADFGLFGCFFALTGVVGSVLTLQYSQALVLPEEERAAAGLFLAGMGSVVLITLVGIAVIVFLQDWVLQVSGMPELRGWLWLAPVAFVVSGFGQMFMAWGTRQKNFSLQSSTQILSAVVKNGSQILLALGGFLSGGLIVGLLLGDAVASLVVARWMWKRDGHHVRQAFNRSEVLGLASRYRDFPIYSCSQNLLSTLSQGAPVLVLTQQFGMTVVGYYAFASRFLLTPWSLAYTSLQRVLFQRMSEANNARQDLKALFKKTCGGLCLVTILPGALGYLLTPALFLLLFGEEWRAAGEYGKWLWVWMVPAYLSLPAAVALRVRRQQRTLLVYEIVLLVVRISTLVLGGVYLRDAALTIAAFATTGGLMELWLIWRAWRLLSANPILSAPGAAA